MIEPQILLTGVALSATLEIEIFFTNTAGQLQALTSKALTIGRGS